MADSNVSALYMDSPTIDQRPPGQAGEMCDYESRRCLLDLSVGLVEDLRRKPVSREKGSENFCSDFQICLPYRGLFVWHVADDDVVGDTNQVVFVRGGESYSMSGPILEGYAEMIITPELDVLSEITHVKVEALTDHPLFRRRFRRASPLLQQFRVSFLHWVWGASDIEALEAEELVLFLLRSALQDEAPLYKSCGATTARLIRQTKELLESDLSNRLRLADVARIVGASPAYLTDVFRHVEGVSLHRYLTSLRLARALVELPHTDDLTALALDLGFSSHSHFSFAFRKAFGSSPSHFRENTRRAVIPTSL